MNFLCLAIMESIFDEKTCGQPTVLPASQGEKSMFVFRALDRQLPLVPVVKPPLHGSGLADVADVTTS